MDFNPHIKKDSKNIAQRLINKNSEFDNSTILITGAFGFLGQQFFYYFSTLIEDLGLNIKIIAFDNFITGNKNLYEIFSKKNYLKLEEIEEAEKLFNIIDIKKINVPQLNAQRHLIIMAPNNETGIYG